MKKQLIIASIAACALTVALASCGSSNAPASDEGSGEAAPVETSAQAEPAEEATSEMEETSPYAGMPNPWSEVGSAEEAAQGAGLDSFGIPTEAEISLGALDHVTYRCMDGIAEADVEFPAVELVIRKGTVPAEEGDISGDYNNYANTWTQNIKGLEITCFGNREGDATKTIWSVDDTYYSINAYGLGGDTDYGLSADDLNTIINGLQ